MGIIMRVFLAGIVGGAVLAVLWVVFFTLVVNWPGHESFTTTAFLLGGLIFAMLGLKGSVW